MNRILKLGLAFTLLLNLSESLAADTLSTVLRPRIGLGTGTFTYYGEIQNYQKNFSPIVNRYGGLVYVNAPVSRYFNLEFSASYGRVAANERTLTRNFNFESRIRMGTIFLYYNFYPFFRSKRSFFHPFIGAGVSSFEFLSKTDLYGANDSMYYYWTDGSIMNMPQNDPLALNAQPVQRDYFYETDLREQNYDSLGKYREQSFGFPVSVGFEWHLSPRWDFRVCGTYYFTLTDLIDNISPAGTGIRQGDKSMDRLLHSYVSLSYDLQFGSGNEEMMEDDEVPLLAEWDLNDWDKDGVIDALDNCAGTPLEALVDEFGCPKDEDRDGVPDYNDDEPATPLGNYVDQYGVTITKEQFDRHWQLYNDSTGYDHDFAEQRTTVVFWKDDRTSFSKPYEAPAGKSYVIIIGKEHKDVSANDLHKFLGYNDYKTIQRGDTIYYVLGEYTKIEDAVAAKTELDSLGVPVELIGRDNQGTGKITEVDSLIVEKVEKVNQDEGKYSTDFSKKHQTYRVQVGAFKNKPDVKTQFPGIDVIYGTGADGITRYYSGNFNTYEEAEAYRKQMVAKGHKNAFVVGYEGPDRKTLVELGVDSTKLPPNYDEKNELNTFVEPRDTTGSQTTTSGKVDMTKVKYHVKMAYVAAGGKLPIETYTALSEIGGTNFIETSEGTTYISRPFTTKADMESAISEYKTYGLENLEGIVVYDDKVYSLEEFQKLLEE